MLYYRRQDRNPSGNSRVCSCHFRAGLKANGPEIFKRNSDKLFPNTETRTPKISNKKKKSKLDDQDNLVVVFEFVEKFNESVDDSSLQNGAANEPSAQEVLATNAKKLILKSEMEKLREELSTLRHREHYQREKYSVLTLKDDVICMETGLPNKQIFSVVVSYVKRFINGVNYFYGWKVDMVLLEDQIFITLMKARQKYTNLHLAQLFNCSTATISNIILTFTHVLHKLLWEDCLITVPSREKNRTSMPESFSVFSNCKMVIDCTDLEIAAPGLMSEQRMTYSTYRGMNSFKTLIGVAPNAVITHVSKLFPGSTSDKAIVENSGVLHHFKPGDLILADKEFLISDVAPVGVSVNIPPFLYNGKFNESEMKLTKTIARCRIHVERANARLKDFKILNFIPRYLHAIRTKFFNCVLDW